MAAGAAPPPLLRMIPSARRRNARGSATRLGAFVVAGPRLLEGADRPDALLSRPFFAGVTRIPRRAPLSEGALLRNPVMHHRAVTLRFTTVACAVMLAACGEGGNVSDTGTAGTPGHGGTNTGGAAGTAGSNGPSGMATGAGGPSQAGSGGQVDSSGAGGGGAGNGEAGGATGTGGSAGDAGGGGAGSTGGGSMTSCVGTSVPTADPTKLGPFATATDKDVGPVAGAPNDPIHGDTPVKFNVYRPMDLASGGHCFPIVIWSNGHGDQPEPSAPECVLNKCGHYATLMQQFASHGFVVVVSLSSQTSKGDPVPSLVGLDWIISQSNDPTSPYYHHLDTAHIGAAGHSEGGFVTTGKMASDPRITAISTFAGSSANAAIHQPVLLSCGGKDPTVSCSGVEKNLDTITNYPAMLINNLQADHVNWSKQDAGGPAMSGFVAWFRVHLMGDTENRKYFYGPSCTFCSDNRVTVKRNSLMAQ